MFAACAIGYNHTFVIDRNGYLWYWHNAVLEPKKVVGLDLPLFVSVVFSENYVIVLDEFDCIWFDALKGKPDVLLRKKRELNNIQAIFPRSTTFNFFCTALDIDGKIWDVNEAESVKVHHDILPPIKYLSSDGGQQGLFAGIDYKDNIWFWKKDIEPEKIDESFLECKLVIAENDCIKILSKDGEIWKYFNSDSPSQCIFNFIQLPKFHKISTSGKYAIALDEGGKSWIWGMASINHCTFGAGGVFHIIGHPILFDKIPPAESIFCGCDRVIVFTKERTVLQIKGDINQVYGLSCKLEFDDLNSIQRIKSARK